LARAAASSIARGRQSRRWQIAATTDGDEVAAVGLEIFFRGADGRIKADYQFIEN
jgi:hypothetical protein